MKELTRYIVFIYVLIKKKRKITKKTIQVKKNKYVDEKGDKL